MSDHPTGTVTFLFTDIEGSTSRWEKNPEAMQRAFVHQEQIIRDVVAARSGYAYKMIGDAFQIAFARASDAVNAAVDAQRALGRGGVIPPEEGDITSPLQIRVRMEQAIEYALEEK